jgi:4-amino-4-deoxy-L-arabinose transferase-like glycosyltransferase
MMNSSDLAGGRLYREHRKLFVLYVATVLILSVLMFFRLGHNPLWDDEAIDAFSGTSILQSGDTKAVVGKNIMGYRSGLLLNNLRVEGEPPFTAYASAGAMALFGKSALAARLPMALMGFSTILLLLWWTWKLRLSFLSVTVVSLAMIGCTAIQLYSRQCHYYAPCIFFCTAITYLYLNWNARYLMLVLMGVCSALLMSANYTCLVVLYGCLFLDYLLFQRHISKFRILDLALIFLPQLIMGLVLLFWWNPFHTHMGDRLAHDSIGERLQLFLWHFRDLNRCEFYSPVLMFLAVFYAVIRKDVMIGRLLLWLLAFMVGMTLLSTQSVKETSVSDIRYFAPVLPLILAIEVCVILVFSRNRALVALLLVIIAFGTNLLNGGSFLCGKLQSTSTAFAEELQAVWVLPDYMAYPLMFHAPNAVYAWQLRPDQKKDHQFSGLPDIHFQGLVSPDYIVAFGPVVIQLRAMLEQWKTMGVNYGEIYRMNTFWKDLYRPELFWRTFKPIRDFDSETQGIYIFKKQKSDNPKK